MLINKLSIPEYIFCLEYFYNHTILNNSFEDHIEHYNEILFGEKKLPRYVYIYNKLVDLPTLYFKSLYNEKITEALKMQNDNIKYCENKLKEKEKENKQWKEYEIRY